MSYHESNNAGGAVDNIISINGNVSGVTESELDTAVAVIEKIVKQGKEYFSSKPLRKLRKAIAPMVDWAMKQRYEGMSEKEWKEMKERKFSVAYMKNKSKVFDRALINNRTLRVGRMRQLQTLVETSASGGATHSIFIPDGPVFDGVNRSIGIHSGTSNVPAIQTLPTMDITHIEDGNANDYLSASTISLTDKMDTLNNNSHNKINLNSINGGKDTDASTHAADINNNNNNAPKLKRTRDNFEDAAVNERNGKESKKSKNIKAYQPTAVTSKENKNEIHFKTAEPINNTEGKDDQNIAEEDVLNNSNRLFYSRSCYVCKARYDMLHHFYDQLCPVCADLNWAKRMQKADLSGKIGLLTGGRIKIGYQAGLKMLRCGAMMIITTRFPADAALRYSREHDFDEWKDRLKVYSVDLRDLKSVEDFCEELNNKLPRLDFIINNACQTVHRPQAYYRHLMDNERKVSEYLRGLTPNLPSFSKENDDGESATSSTITETHPQVSVVSNLIVKSNCHQDATLNLSQSQKRSPPISLLSNIVNLNNEEQSNQQTNNNGNSNSDSNNNNMELINQHSEENENDEALFPVGVYDVNAQQIDLRTKNSWVLRLDEVKTSELLEVTAVNSLSPFIINARLKRLLIKAREFDIANGKDDLGRYIVNVSAMEGKFYRRKNANHPHTNMCKAALNMMTRTSAQDYMQDGIYMNSVDTGW